MSLGETLLRPTAMLYRNLASMDVEESIRGNPVDGVVLLMGCDKTTPSLIMGAASADLPTIGVSGGPMLNGKWRGQELGSGTGMWSMSEQVRAGTLKLADFFEAESCMHRSHGHCMTMGTASTMACMVEALGVGLPGNAAYPAVDGRRNVLARMAGRRIVEMVHSDQKISSILTREAFENAIKTLAAIGGSTNAVIHLIAMAGRLGVPLSIDDFDRLASELPCLLNLQPSGEHLMEDFCYAGGLPAVMKEIEHLLHTDMHHRQRSVRERKHGRAVKTTTPASSSPLPNPSKTKPALRCCAAIWPPRCGHQAQCGHARVDGAHRPRCGV
jgi:L-arabonate dehydrase